MSTPEMIKVKTADVEICLHRWKGQGQPVLAVHGLTANGRSFDTIANEISSSCELWALDLRGRGRSQKPDKGYSLQVHASDIEAALDELGINKVIMMGHSLGAYICLAFCHLRPDLVLKMILIDAGANLTVEQWGKVTSGIKPSLDLLDKDFSSIEEYFDYVKKAPFLNPWTKAHEEYYRYGCKEKDNRIYSRTRPEHIKIEKENLLKTDIGQFYPKVKCPVLVLRATKGMLDQGDLVLPEESLEQFQKELPQAEIENLELNHFSIVFQGDAKRARLIKDFVSA